MDGEPEQLVSHEALLRSVSKELRCCICLDYFTEDVSVLPCSHAFCSDCITAALAAARRCPLCKRSCEPRSIVKVPSLGALSSLCQRIADHYGVADTELSQAEITNSSELDVAENVQASIMDRFTSLTQQVQLVKTQGAPPEGSAETTSTPAEDEPMVAPPAGTECALCHLDSTNRKRIRSFLKFVVANDESCDRSGIEAVNQEALEVMFGGLCGPFQLRGKDVYAHYCCLLWSSEVQVSSSGALMNTQAAITRGSRIRCAFCDQFGATLGCHESRCRKSFHVPCAMFTGRDVCQTDEAMLTLHCAKHSVTQQSSEK